MNNDNVGKGGTPQKDFLPRMGAGCLMVLGGLMAILGVAVLADKSEGSVPGFFFCVIIGAALGGAGIFWYRYIRDRDRHQVDSHTEKTLLGLAARHNGYLTLTIVALESDYTAAEADAAMTRMVRGGFAQPELMDDGTVRYRFGGLIDEGQA